jgi:hypothetical protein
MARAKLTEQQKIYVVKRLAAYVPPATIARDLAKEFGVTVTQQSVAEYEPGRKAGRRLAPRWHKLFAQEREGYLASTAQIGVEKAEPAPCREVSAQAPSSTQNRLTDQQRIYVVRRLAAYDKPGEIAKSLAQEFGVTISINAIEGYNPGLSAGRNLAQRWRDLFAQAREAYLESTAEIGVAHKAVRIRLREGYAHRAFEEGQFKAASDILDAIARDVGDAFDKRKTHGRFMEFGAAPGATIIINGRTEVGPAPVEPAPDAEDGVADPHDLAEPPEDE